MIYQIITFNHKINKLVYKLKKNFIKNKTIMIINYWYKNGEITNFNLKYL